MPAALLLRSAAALVRPVAVVTLLAFSAACTRSFTIEPSELRKLDGYSPETRLTSAPFFHPDGSEPHLRAELLPQGTALLQSSDGERIDFDTDSALVIDGPAGRATGELLSARMEGDRLLGTLRDGPTLDVQLSQVRSAEVTNFNGPRTALLVIALVAAAAVLTPFLLVAAGVGKN